MNILSETKYELFTDKDRIEVDKLHSAQEQLNHLTKDAPFWTAPTKGLATVLIGAGIIIAAKIYTQDEDTQTTLVGTGIAVIGTGAIFTGFAAGNNSVQREMYKHIIYNLKKN